MTRLIRKGSLPLMLALGSAVTAGVSLAPASAHAQQPAAQPPVVVMGLRAINGDDDIALAVTAALRRAVEAKGLPVNGTSPSLDQSMAVFQCDDTLPADCLGRIADDLHTTRVVYGLVKREGRGRTAPLVVEVKLFDRRENASSEQSRFQVSRDDARRGDRLAPFADNVANALFPRTGTAIETGSVLIAGGRNTGTGDRIVLGTTGTGAGTGTGTGTSGSQMPPPPPGGGGGRKGAGIGLLVGGGVVMIIGASLGGAWLGFNGGINGSEGADANAWNSYQPFGNDPRATNGGDICNAANDMNYAYNGTFPQADLTRVKRICGDHSMFQLGQWGFIGLGAGLAIVGAVLIATDSGPAPAARANANLTPAQASREALRPHVGVTPNLSPTYSGATLQVVF